MKINQQRVYTDAMPKMTPDQVRHYMKVQGQEPPKEQSSLDHIPNDLALQLMAMGKQQEAMMMELRSMREQNERIMKENAELKSKKEPTKNESAPKVEAPAPANSKKKTHSEDIPTPEK